MQTYMHTSLIHTSDQWLSVARPRMGSWCWTGPSQPGRWPRDSVRRTWRICGRWRSPGPPWHSSRRAAPSPSFSRRATSWEKVEQWVIMGVCVCAWCMGIYWDILEYVGIYWNIWENKGIYEMWMANEWGLDEDENGELGDSWWIRFDWMMYVIFGIL